MHPSTQLSVGLRQGWADGRGKRPKAGAPEVVWADVPSPANAVDGDRLAVVNVGAAAVRPWSIHLSREVKPLVARLCLDVREKNAAVLRREHRRTVVARADQVA